MLLLDLSQLCLSSTFVFAKDLQIGSATKEDCCNIIRHIVLSQIKAYKKKYSTQYGDIVISCDSHHYWRKDLFSNYKILRKQVREESNLDWKLIFDSISEIIKDLKENFEYKVLLVDGAESDDIIGVLTKKVSEETGEDVLIVSSDKDFLQLQIYPNVRQISPATKRYVISDDPHRYLKEKVIRGDSGDGIPNILSGDNFFLEDKRAQPITKKKLEYFLEVYDSRDKIEDESIKKNLERNSKLIDFKYIPKNIEDSILEEYNKPILGNRTKMFNYLVEKKCATLLKDIKSF